MENKEFLAHLDHTNLNSCATWEEIKRTIDQGIQYGCASVCIAPSHVRAAAQFAAGRIPICTVAGFPRGDHTTAVKVFEAEEAVRNGAGEVDMVINLGWLKGGNYNEVQEEIRAVREVCPGILKVIVETSELTEAEKITVCTLVTNAGADFIKTSTGFTASGAKLEDVRLFAKHVGPGVRIKASGGVSTREAAEQFIAAGAARIGTSRTAKLAQPVEKDSGR